MERMDVVTGSSKRPSKAHASAALEDIEGEEFQGFQQDEAMDAREQGKVGSTGTPGSESLPLYLSTKSLAKRCYLSASTGNIHGLKSADYEKTRWPLPKMFGNEKYAYNLIDIEEPRYAVRASQMGKQLIRFFYDQQILDLEWRKTYKALQDAEHRRNTMPETMRQAARDRVEREVTEKRKYLLELQEQKDIYEENVQKIWKECDTTKRSIQKETDLENLRQEMSDRTRDRIGDAEAPFWSKKFNPQSHMPRRPSKDWVRRGLHCIEAAHR